MVHVHQKFYPYQGGSTHRLLNQLKNMDFNTYSIIVISQKIGNDKNVEMYNGIKIITYQKFHQIIGILNDIEKKDGIDLLHAHNYRPSFYTAIFNQLYNKKMIIEMHSIYEVSNWFKKSISRFLLKLADKIIVLSNESKRIINEEYEIDIDTEIIYNGVEIESFIQSDGKLSNKYSDIRKYIVDSRNNGNIIVGYIGSLREFQGINNIIKIINSINNSNISFIIIGGTENESYEVSKKITNSNVFIKPFIESNQVKKIYKNIDILLMPRPKTKATQSAIPLKPIESLASGNIIYSTKVGGMVELNGILKSKKIVFMTVDEMIKNLNTLKFTPHISEKNIEKLFIFDEKNQASKLLNIYKDIIN